MNFLRERLGIYGLGFDKESFLGLVLPIAFVLIVGGGGVVLVTNGLGGLIPLPFR